LKTKKILLLISLFLTNLLFLNSNSDVDIKEVPEISIEILGNDLLNTEELEMELGIDSNLFNFYKIFKNTKIKENEILNFKNNIISVYKDYGFLDTKIKIIHTKQKIIYNIKEGKSLIFKNFVINNKVGEINIYKMLNINLGDRFNSSKISLLKEKINNTLLSLNYPLPNFKINIVLNEEDTTLTLHIDIPLNKKYIVKSINIHNDTNISNVYLLEKIQLRKNKYYNNSDELKTLYNLKKLNMFQNIRIQKKLINDELIINVYIKHILNNKYKASIGFDTDEYVKGKLFFKHSNFLNTYGNITTNIKASQINQYLFLRYDNHLSTKTNYFINTLLEHKQNNKFEFISYNLENGIKYNLIGNNYFIIRYSKNNIIYDFIKNQKTNYDIYSFIYKFELKKTINDKLGFNVEEGEKFNFYMEKSFYSNIDFIKVKSKLLKLKDFMGNKILLKLKYYFIKELNSNPIPTPLLFPVGGILSNRGLDYEYTYTDNLFENTIEIHTKVRKDLYIAVFEDYSYFKNIATKKYEDIFSIGTGLRFKTKIGVFKLDVAKKVNDFENSTYKINFGYGYDF